MTTRALETSTISCRRCGENYVVCRATLLPACPRCGKSPAPLWRRMRSNAVAAVLSMLALLVLTPAVVMPLVSMKKFGTDNVYSLIGGIVKMFEAGEIFLGAVLLLFSVVFPFAKLLSLLVATSALAPLSLKTRHRLHTLASVTGKYSLLDILVVAIMIVLVKFRHVAEVQARPGTVLFCLAILLSIAAGMCVNFDDVVEERETRG
jgi:paraquat-inducible protein A